MPNPYFDVLVAVKASLETILGHPTVDIRHDVAQFDKSIDTLPLIIVAPAPERQQIVDGAFDADVVYDYPVDIAWIEGSGRTVKTGLEAYLQMEWDIQSKLFHVTLASVSAVYDTNQGPAVADKIPKAGLENLRVRGWRFKYRSEETRSS